MHHNVFSNERCWKCSGQSVTVFLSLCFSVENNEPSFRMVLVVKLLLRWVHFLSAHHVQAD